MQKRFLLFLALIVALIPIIAYAATYRDAPATEVPLFQQSDARWADIMYSNHGDKSQTIKRGGCTLCSTASVVNALCDDTVTPVTMAELSMCCGTCSDRGWTYTSFYSVLPHYYSLTLTVTQSLDEAIRCLDDGGLVIMGYDSHSRVIYAHTGQDYWLHDSGWEGVLTQIMGHMTYDKLQQKTATYYCYKGK